MNKRILSLVLALVMVLGTFAVVSAEEAKVPEYTTQAQKIQWLIDNKIVTGNKIGKDGEATELDLEGNLTREQATKLLVYVVGQENLADTLKGSLKLFKDVDLDRWSNGYINVAATHKENVKGEAIVKGYPDGTFGPERNVTYAELATMLVRIVKGDMLNNDDIKFAGANWATQYMRWAAENGILDGLKVTDSNAPASRKDAFEMIFNTIYKLGRYTGNKAEFGINMGIVSKLQSGKIEINQDSEKTYNITYNTKIVNNVSGAELAANAVIPGSLVRYIVDADKNVERILVMSTPEVGYGTNFVNYSGYHTTSNDRVFGVGEAVLGKTKGSLVLDSSYRPSVGTIEVRENGAPVGSVEVTSKTRVFVADPRNNALKEFDSIEDALRVFNTNKNEFKGFAIYDTYTDYRGVENKEATVLVFTQTDKPNFSTNTYRVRYDVNSKYFAGLEEANNGKIVSIDFAGVNFLPGSYNTHNMDVVSFGNPSGNDGVYAKTIIDYSADNVYEVVSIADRYITVRTEAKYNREARIGMPTSTKVFNDGKALRVGDHIQISREATADNVKVISVVDKALKGNINLGTEVDTSLVRAYVSAVSKAQVHTGYDVVTVYDMDSNGYKYNYRTLLVPQGQVTEQDKDNFYEFRVTNGYFWANGIPVAVEWKNVTKVVEDAIAAYKAEPTALNYEKALTAIDQMPTSNKAEKDAKQAQLDKLNDIKKEVEKLDGAKLVVEVSETELTTEDTYLDLKKSLVVKFQPKEGEAVQLKENEFGIKGHSHKENLEAGENQKFTVVYKGLEAEFTKSIAEK